MSRLVGQAVGGGEAGMRAFMEAELFGPLGMTSADPRFDAAGTFIGSSFLYCTARDFARFGQLYLADGVWEGRRILPEGWVDFARTPGPRAGRTRSSATAPTGGSGTATASRARSPPTATRASTSSCAPTGTWSWCASARRPIEVRPPVIEHLQELLGAW